MSKSSGAERELSLYVKERAGYRCEFHAKCKEKGIDPPCRCGGRMNAQHKISKGRGNFFRYNDRNMFCGCSGSNVFESYNRDRMQAIFRQLWPEDYEYLERPRKPVKMDLDMVRLYYKQKRAELERETVTAG